MSDETFPAQLWALADLFTPMAVRVAATLRLADHIAAGTSSVEALAQRTETDADALGRVVKHLVTAGVLSDVDDGVELTALGEQLRSDDPGNARAWLDIEGAVGRADLSAMHLLDAVRTGRPAYPVTYGRGFWEDLSADRALGRSYDALMGSRIEVDDVVRGYDWSPFTHVVDVGGGTGSLLAAVLVARPELRGTLVDLASPIEAAGEVLARAGVTDRCATVVSSAFDPLPGGGDAYVLSSVLHAFGDDDALAILRRCAEAAGADGRVLVIENPLDEDAETGSTELDLRMLAYVGGRERTLEEFGGLAAGAGLRVEAVVRVARYSSVIDLRA